MKQKRYDERVECIWDGGGGCDETRGCMSDDDTRNRRVYG